MRPDNKPAGDPAAWKDNEIAYCLDLVACRGDSKVPRGAVLSYLELQHGYTMRDGARAAESVLADCIMRWRAILAGNDAAAPRLPRSKRRD